MKNTIVMSSYLIFPIMLGLAAVAEPLVCVFLTETWLPCVPFLQLCSLSMVLYPLHSCNVQAIKAMGRSDIFLKLEVIKTLMDVPFFLIALLCFDDPLALAAYGTISSWVYLIVNSWPNKKLIDYSGWEQLRDVLSTLALSLLMFGCVMLIRIPCTMVALPDMALLVLQVLAGVVVYALSSIIFKPRPYRMALEMMKKMRNKDEE